MLRFGSDVKTWLAWTGEATAERVADVGFDDRTWQIIALKIRRRRFLGCRVVALEGPFVQIAGGEALVLLPGNLFSTVTAEVMAGLRTPSEKETSLPVGVFEGPDTETYGHLRWMEDLLRFCLQSVTGEIGLIDTLVVRDDPPSLDAFVIERLNGASRRRSLIFAGQVQRVDDRGRKIWFDAALPGAREPVRDVSSGTAVIRDEGLREVAADLRWTEVAPEARERRARSRQGRFVTRFLRPLDEVRQ